MSTHSRFVRLGDALTNVGQVLLAVVFWTAAVAGLAGLGVTAFLFLLDLIGRYLR